MTVLHQTLEQYGAQFQQTRKGLYPGHFINTCDEYTNVVASAGLMDRSYTGHLHISGKDHVDYLHRITTNELRHLKPGESQTTVFTNEIGRIIDRVSLLKYDDRFHMLTSANGSAVLQGWLEKYIIIEDVSIADLSEELGVLTLFGPAAGALLNSSFEADLKQTGATFTTVRWRDFDITIVPTHELHLPGFDIVTARAALPGIWNQLVDNDARLKVQPMGENSYEILRIESAWPEKTKEITDDINPHEAAMLDYVDFDKGCYIGQEVIARLDSYEKVKKRLMGLVFANEIPQDELLNARVFLNDIEIGYLTSAVYSCELEKSIALCYISSRYLNPDEQVVVAHHDQAFSAKMVSLPFIARK
jgi:folate-binding protein YgfZ